MEDKHIRKINNDRINPRMWRWDYLALRSILKNLREFSKTVQKNNAKKILDLGCGTKPYETLFKFSNQFVGFDIEKNDRVDVIGFNWDLPFEDNEFDALISTQVLEHTAKIGETIKEIRRVVKNDGLVFISAPFVFPVLGAPYDYYRFTKYGLLEIFKDFEVIKIIPSGGFANTILRMFNVFLFSIPGIRYLFTPFYFFNNLSALFFDQTIFLIHNLLREKKIGGLVENLYFSFPENYCLVVRNKK